MMSFLALHRIAAQRGEGLRPELVRLLERRGCAESGSTSPAAQMPDLIPHDTDMSDGSSPGHQDPVARLARPATILGAR